MDIQPGQHGVLQMLELVTISWDCDVVVLVDNGYQDMLVKSNPFKPVHCGLEQCWL